MGRKRYRELYKIGRIDKGKRRMKLRKKEKIKKKAKKKEKIEKKKDHDKKTAKWIRKTGIQNEKKKKTNKRRATAVRFSILAPRNSSWYDLHSS